jgi:hypothetical protein
MRNDSVDTSIFVHLVVLILHLLLRSRRRDNTCRKKESIGD